MIASLTPGFNSQITMNRENFSSARLEINFTKIARIALLVLASITVVFCAACLTAGLILADGPLAVTAGIILLLALIIILATVILRRRSGYNYMQVDSQFDKSYYRPNIPQHHVVPNSRNDKTDNLPTNPFAIGPGQHVIPGSRKDS